MIGFVYGLLRELDLYLIGLSSAFRQVVQLKMGTTGVLLAGVFSPGLEQCH